jgi:hypothetical protein
MVECCYSKGEVFLAVRRLGRSVCLLVGSDPTESPTTRLLAVGWVKIARGHSAYMTEDQVRCPGARLAACGLGCRAGVYGA